MGAWGWVGFRIVAAPCVDPFSIGLLTYVAAKANPFLGSSSSSLFSGLGFPTLAGVFLREIGHLPRPVPGWSGEKGFRSGAFGMPCISLPRSCRKGSIEWLFPLPGDGGFYWDGLRGKIGHSRF